MWKSCHSPDVSRRKEQNSNDIPGQSGPPYYHTRAHISRVFKVTVNWAQASIPAFGMSLYDYHPTAIFSLWPVYATGYVHCTEARKDICTGVIQRRRRRPANPSGALILKSWLLLQCLCKRYRRTPRSPRSHLRV